MLYRSSSEKALNTEDAISYTQLKYENKITFQFLPKKSVLFKKAKIAESVAQWFTYCLEKGLQDIKIIVPVSVNDRALLGFSNAIQSTLICFWRERVTYFIARWDFDSVKNMWNILYIEQEWFDAPSGKLRFENNIEEFKSVLTEIKELAHNIEQDYFTEVFQRAFNILSDSFDCKEMGHDLPPPDIPEENLRLFQAASIADVFGAMGSWNDSPAYVAHEKGLGEEYNTLSEELLKQVRLALLYAINEW